MSHQEDTINLYALTNMSSKHIKQKLIKLWEVGRFTIIVGYFKVPSSKTDGLNRLKISKYMEDLNNKK